jgi:glycosyltransferase involved in cell wall biosynthesis
MAKQGHIAAEITSPELVYYVRMGVEIWKDFDIILLQRLLVEKDADAGVLRQLPLLLRGAGLTVIVDYDDDITNEHRTVSQGIIPDLTALSGIIVSTQFLKQRLSKLNDCVIVLPNLVPFDMFKGFKRALEGPVISIDGSVTHEKDWEVLAAPLYSLAQRHKFTLLVAGHMPEYLKGLPNLVTPGDFIAGLPNGELSVALKDYGVIKANADIQLCPVDPDDLFNHSKSGLKAMEAQASARDVGDGRTGGCAVIASGDLPIYHDAVEDGKTGLLVNHHSELQWERAIERLLTDVQVRRDLQVAGYEHCKRHFSVETRVSDRVAAYRKIIERDRRNHYKTMAGVAALLQKELLPQPAVA